MNLKPQTVYIPTHLHSNHYVRTRLGEHSGTFTEVSKEEKILLSKEQLIELLQTSFDYGVQRVQMGKLTPDRNTFIHLIIH